MGLVEAYIIRQKNVVAQYIETNPILYIFTGTERMAGSRAPMRWWEHVGINLTGYQATTEADMEESRKTE